VFSWPACGREAFYLFDPKSELVMLCLAGGIQVFYSQSYVKPGGGLHFVRVSDQVVMETPENFPEKPDFRAILESLGVKVGQFITPVAGSPSIGQDMRKHNLLCREMLTIGPRLPYDTFGDLNTCTKRMLEHWAYYANWSSDGVRSVLRQLASDLAGTSAWQKIIDCIAPIVNARNEDFDAITMCGSELRRHKPKLFVGSRYSAERMAAKLDQIWHLTRIEKTEADLPGTIRRERAR
jgi:hypothetical protein